MRIAELVCKHLPEFWEITIYLEKGHGEVFLYDPEGYRLDRCSDGMTLEEKILDALNHARSVNGLSPVGPAV